MSYRVMVRRSVPIVCTTNARQASVHPDLIYINGSTGNMYMFGWTRRQRDSDCKRRLSRVVDEYDRSVRK